MYAPFVFIQVWFKKHIGWTYQMMGSCTYSLGFSISKPIFCSLGRGTAVAHWRSQGTAQIQIAPCQPFLTAEDLTEILLHQYYIMHRMGPPPHYASTLLAAGDLENILTLLENYLLHRMSVRHEPRITLHNLTEEDLDDWLAESFVRQSLQPGCHQWAQEWIHWKVKIRISSILLGGLEHEWIMTFPSYWEFHHPNWRAHIFQRGRAQPPTRFWPFQVFVEWPGFSQDVLHLFHVTLQ